MVERPERVDRTIDSDGVRDSAVAMLIFSGTISAFVERHPTIKMLNLSFLFLIGVNLIAEGAGVHIPKGYIYFAMDFALFVELLNLKLRTHRLRKIR